MWLKTLCFCVFIFAATASINLKDICRQDHTPCDGGKTCFHSSQKCDGRNDCQDGTDEILCPKCGPNEVRCLDAKCFAITKLCDGVNDCQRGEDEKDCGAFNSPTVSLIGNQNADILERSGHPARSPLAFPKPNSVNLGDNEFIETEGDYRSKQDWHRGLFQSGNKKSVDGESSNPNLTSVDEENKAIDKRFVQEVPYNYVHEATFYGCGRGFFECNSWCVPDEYYCIPHKPYAEQTCVKEGEFLHIMCHAYICRQDHTPCDGGKTCFHSSQKCDGRNDCQDGTDEILCPINTCPSNLYCYDGTCLQNHEICDGVRQCSSGEDEWQCKIYPTGIKCRDNPKIPPPTTTTTTTTTRKPVFMCPRGTELVYNKCISIEFSETFSWNTARQECYSTGAVLLEIESNEFFDALRSKLTASNLDQYSFWVGGTDVGHEGHWVWDHSRTQVTMGPDFWAPIPEYAGTSYQRTSPDGGYEENCAFLGYCTKSQKLEDHNCSLLKGYICEAPGSYY